MNIARAYGMMPEHMQGTELTRACCFIPPSSALSTDTLSDAGWQIY